MSKKKIRKTKDQSTKNSSSRAKSKGKGSKKKKPTLAERADKYALYQESVQAADYEVKLFDRVFKKEFGRKPVTLREDFCGTHAVCCEWVKRGKDRLATGVDIDPEPLEWGKEHNQADLKEHQKERIRLIQDDVRTNGDEKVDVLAAENFSYWIFKTRDELREYFKVARGNLNDQGVMVMDLMGGPESMTEDITDVRPHKGFKYVWDQYRIDPITHDAVFHIHFRFKDKSKLERAFTYHWRFWTIPELRELLTEAGFSRVDVYWEGTDPDTGEGNDIYGKTDSAPMDASFVAYLVAVK